MASLSRIGVTALELTVANNFVFNAILNYTTFFDVTMYVEIYYKSISIGI